MRPRESTNAHPANAGAAAHATADATPHCTATRTSEGRACAHHRAVAEPPQRAVSPHAGLASTRNCRRRRAHRHGREKSPTTTPAREERTLFSVAVAAASARTRARTTTARLAASARCRSLARLGRHGSGSGNVSDALANDNRGGVFRTLHQPGGQHQAGRRVFELHLCGVCLTVLSPVLRRAPKSNLWAAPLECAACIGGGVSSPQSATTRTPRGYQVQHDPRPKGRPWRHTCGAHR